MIKCDMGKTEIFGSSHDLMAEYTEISRAMYKMFCNEFGEETANAHIDFCIRTAKKSEEEIHEEAEKASENLNRAKSLLEDILKKIEES